MLRRRADSSRDDSVWVEGKHCVDNSDIVQVLRHNAEGEQGFAWIRTQCGHEGFIRSELLRVRPAPSLMIAGATIHRQDGEASTMLRQVPKMSREQGVWVNGHHVSSSRAVALALLCCRDYSNTVCIALPRGRV
jgi:hypothetical protein